MARVPETSLRDIGLEAAREVVGEGRAEDVRVTPGEDSTNRPAYVFEFLMEQDRDRKKAALLRIRLGQRIRDKLMTLGDARYPFISVHGREDWTRLSA